MILVTGATGNVGREVVRALVDRGQQVRALTRDGQAKGLPDAAEPVAGDLDHPDTLKPALDGASGLFLLPGYPDTPGLLATAGRSGVGRVVLLSGGSAGDGDLTNAISRYMIRSEEAVRGSGLAWTILRPSAFMSNVFRWLPLRAGDVVRVPFAGVRTAVIDPADIGAVAAAALTEDGHDGATYRLTGPESLLPAQQVEILARVLRRALRFEAQPNDEARAEMSAAMPAEYVDAFFRFNVDGELDESMVLPTVPEITGRPARTFEQWARTHAGAFA
jgi:uncharacterized protein YbjT (DUF2867 family)